MPAPPPVQHTHRPHWCCSRQLNQDTVMANGCMLELQPQWWDLIKTVSTIKVLERHSHVMAGVGVAVTGEYPSAARMARRTGCCPRARTPARSCGRPLRLNGSSIAACTRSTQGEGVLQQKQAAAVSDYQRLEAMALVRQLVARLVCWFKNTGCCHVCPSLPALGHLPAELCGRTPSSEG